MDQADKQTSVYLRHGDCVNVLRNADDWQEQFDVIVTSPPYNLGKDYGAGVSDKRSPAQYLDWVDDWLRLLKVVLKPGGSLFLNIGSKPSSPMLPFQVLGVASSNWKLQNTIHWIKSVTIPDGAGGEVTRGHFKPINSPRFLNDLHEYVFHLTHDGKVPIERKAKGVGTTYTDKSNVGRWAGQADLKCRGNVWFMPYETIQSTDKHRPHPATFPVELPERCIRLHGGDLRTLNVLDPFVGLGSTVVAAVRCGVNYVAGIDANQDYLKYAEERAFI